MAGELGRCLCVPLKVNLQDGMRAAAGWEGAARAGVSAESHVVQSVRCAFEAARGLGGRCLLAMDRYFLTVPALRTLAELNAGAESDGLGAGLVHIVTKAKGNFVAYLPARPRPAGTRGRPPKKGARVVVSRVLGSLVYEPVDAVVGAAGTRRLHAATLDLVWGKGLWAPVRVVVVTGPPWGGRAQILVTTDRTLSARQVIEVYCSRWKIECTFRDMKVELCGFGYRFHPILKYRRLHTGIDLTASTGTPIYATGDGVVRVATRNAEGYAGYGVVAMIDHGFGFQTLYAHMASVSVRPGQRVKRGEQIGTVGSSGMSSGSHLHYEVILNGKKVDPVYYFFNDLTPAEYEEVLEAARQDNQSMS